MNSYSVYENSIKHILKEIIWGGGKRRAGCNGITDFRVDAKKAEMTFLHIEL